MNYLAHAYLSFRNPEILFGNIISDFVKGKKKFDYPPGVQQGIALHLAIDAFTDSHTVTKKAKAVFQADYRLYSGAFVDIVYDHFLANDLNAFTNAAVLHDFSHTTYSSLSSYQAIFPEKFQLFFHHMRKENWLYNYQFGHGIEKSFQGLVHRSAYLKESKKAFSLFNEHFDYLHECYKEFFPDLQKFAMDNFPEKLSLNS